MPFPAPIKPTSNRSQLLLRELPEAHTSITTHDQNRSKKTSFSSNHKMKHSTKSTTLSGIQQKQLCAKKRSKQKCTLYNHNMEHSTKSITSLIEIRQRKKYSASSLRIMSISSSLLKGSLLKPYMLPRVCNNHNENVILYYRGIEYCNIG